MLSALALLAAVAFTAASDEETARQDRAQFPAELHPHLYYVTTAPIADPAEREDLTIALRLAVPSVSRQPVLERCAPVPVTDTLYRLNLLDLAWNHAEWLAVVKHHPYTSSENPLVLRGDWLLIAITDAQESDAYYRLLFGKRPETRDEALAILGVDADPSARYGLIEGESGVSKQGVRWLESRPAKRGYAWGTRDVLKLTAERDMLEQPGGEFKHDGEEWIIGMRKFSLRSGRQGALQAYFLAAGDGKIVDRAPVDLVEDSTEFRGYREIRTAGSCIQCHGQGLNYPTTNELRRLVADGVDAYADYDKQQELEAFHFADFERELRRANEDFGVAVKEACGVESNAAARKYRDAVHRYDEDVDLDRAAGELGVASDELRLALAGASARGVQLTARLAGLAHGRTIPREAWEESYLAVRQLYHDWSSQQ